ncbi:MAG: hypothetical protein JW878_10975 [Methanomicrobia archaeon]|nr:hypothetical protein [Methanomicrobia archaeon]
MYNFFAVKQKIPPENVIELYDEEATSQNLQNAVQKIAGKADDNSLVYVYLDGHSGTGYIKLADRRTPYEEIDGGLDEINAGLVIVNPDGCKSGSAIEPMKEGPCPRIVITMTDAETNTGGCVTSNIAHLVGCDIEERRQHFYNFPKGPDYHLKQELRFIKDYDTNHDGYFSLGEARGFVLYQNPDSQLSDPLNLAPEVYIGDWRVYRPETIENLLYTE